MWRSSCTLSPITARPISQPRKPSRRVPSQSRCRSKSPLLNYPSFLIRYYRVAVASLALSVHYFDASVSSPSRGREMPKTLRVEKNKKWYLERYHLYICIYIHTNTFASISRRLTYEITFRVVSYQVLSNNVEISLERTNMKSRDVEKSSNRVLPFVTTI